jgi:hypothetical protein
LHVIIVEVLRFGLFYNFKNWTILCAELNFSISQQLELNTSNSTQYTWEIPKVELMLITRVPNPHLYGLVFSSPIFEFTKVTNLCWKHTFTYIETHTFYIENMYVLTPKNPSQISENPPPNQLALIFWLIITTLSPPTNRRCLQQLFGLKFFHGLTPKKGTKYLVHWLAQIFIYIQENTQAL